MALKLFQNQIKKTPDFNQAMFDLENPGSPLSSENTQLPSNPLTAPIQDLSDITKEKKKKPLSWLRRAFNPSYGYKSRVYTGPYNNSKNKSSPGSGEGPGGGGKGSSGGGSVSGGRSGGGTSNKGRYGGPSFSGGSVSGSSGGKRGSGGSPSGEGSSGGGRGVSGRGRSATSARAGSYKPIKTDFSVPGYTGGGGGRGNLSSLYNSAANRLKDTYTKTVQNKVNELNRRGLFGSSVASDDVAGINTAFGRAIADLGANIAGQEFDTRSRAGLQDAQRYATLANVQLRQKQLEALQNSQNASNTLALLGLLK